MAEPVGEPAPDRSGPTPEPPPEPLPLVLLHGVGQGPMAWQPVVEVIGSSRRIVAPWLQGLRPGRTDAFDLDSATSAVAQHLQLQGLERVALVGQSLGAVVAARLAAIEPALIDRLLLASPPVTPPGWLLAVQRGVVALTPRGVFARKGVSKAAVGSALAVAAALDLRADLERLPVPPRVVVGSRDRPAQLAAHEIAQRAAGTTTSTIEGAGPDLLRDAGAEFGRIIAEWLA